MGSCDGLADEGCLFCAHSPLVALFQSWRARLAGRSTTAPHGYERVARFLIDSYAHRSVQASPREYRRLILSINLVIESP